MEEQTQGSIWYKISPDKKYRIYRNEYNNIFYYYVIVQQKNYDGTKVKFKLPVSFKRGVEVPNETDIIIKKGIENLRENKLDKYNPIHTIMITEFETVENEEKKEQEAYNDFRDNLEENKNNDDVYVDFGNEITLDEEEPF